MIPKRIEDSNRQLAKPTGWEVETHGPYCGGLAVVVAKNKAGVTMTTSCWELTPGDYAALVSGGSIHLTVLGDYHPAIAMTVAP